MIDGDPQGDVSKSLGWKRTDKIPYTLSDVMQKIVNGETLNSREGSRVEWCACFVSWCADQCGYLDNGLVPKFSLCSEGAKWFQNQGRFLDGSSVPTVGSIIFFDWGDDGSVNHVGIVKKVEKGTVHTIEGNSGNKYRERSYVIGDSRIYGYGIL